MSNKELITQIMAKVLDTTPETVLERFRSTGIWDLPEMQNQPTEAVQIWIQDLPLPLVRVVVTAMLDQLKGSMRSFEQMIKKG